MWEGYPSFIALIVEHMYWWHDPWMAEASAEKLYINDIFVKILYKNKFTNEYNQSYTFVIARWFSKRCIFAAVRLQVNTKL